VQRDDRHAHKPEKIDAETCEVHGIESSGNENATRQLGEKHCGYDRSAPAFR